MRSGTRSFLTLLGALAVSTSAAAQTNWVLKPNWFMREGGFLKNGEYIQSQNHAFFLAMTLEGHLALHKGSGPTTNYGQIWSPNSNQPAGPSYAIVQADGNFAVYRGTPGGLSVNVWHSGTGAGTPTANSHALMVLGDNGDILLYNTATAVGPGVWHSRTATKIDWIPHARRMVFGNSGRALNTGIPVNTGGQEAGSSATDVAQRWQLMPDGSIRMARDPQFCVKGLRNTEPNSLYVQQCSNMADPYGWRYDPSTGRLDHLKWAGCVGYHVGWKMVMITNPCPLTDKKAPPELVDGYRVRWVP